MITLKEIKDAQAVLGKFVKYFLTNPKDFIILIKEDVSLALRYAEVFSAEHLVTLLASSYEVRVKLFSEIMQLYHENFPIHVNVPSIASTIPAPAQVLKKMDRDEIGKYMQEIFSDLTCIRNDEIEEGWSSSYTIEQYDYYAEDHRLFCTNRNKKVEEAFSFDIPACIAAYNAIQKQRTQNDQHRLERQRRELIERAEKRECLLKDRQRIIDVVVVLLGKLDETLFIMANNNERVMMLEGEFKDLKFSKSSMSFSLGFFWSSSASINLLDLLMQAQRYDLIAKTISLISPDLMMAELARNLSTCLFKKIIETAPASNLVIEAIASNLLLTDPARIKVIFPVELLWELIKLLPASEPVIAATLTNMEKMIPQSFETYWLALNHDVLGLLRGKSEALGLRFYAINPEFMQQQYPASISGCGAPPPYSPSPFYNPLVFKK